MAGPPENADTSASCSEKVPHVANAEVFVGKDEKLPMDVDMSSAGNHLSGSDDEVYDSDRERRELEEEIKDMEMRNGHFVRAGSPEISSPENQSSNRDGQLLCEGGDRSCHVADGEWLHGLHASHVMHPFLAKSDETPPQGPFSADGTSHPPPHAPTTATHPLPTPLLTLKSGCTCMPHHPCEAPTSPDLSAITPHDSNCPHGKESLTYTTYDSKPPPTSYTPPSAKAPSLSVDGKSFTNSQDMIRPKNKKDTQNPTPHVRPCKVICKELWTTTPLTLFVTPTHMARTLWTMMGSMARHKTPSSPSHCVLSRLKRPRLSTSWRPTKYVA